MAGPQDFTGSEWVTLQFAPMWVFYLVSRADDDVHGDESMSVIEEMVSGAVKTEGELADHVMKAISHDFTGIWKRFFLDERRAADGLAEVAKLLDEKAGTDTGEFRSSMMALARKVAEAVGGVVAGEKEVLKKVAAALGAPAA